MQLQRWLAGRLIDQATAVQSLDPALGPESDALVILHFARSLYAVQDFYAHSNWVELGGQTLVDRSLSAFPTLTPYTIVPASGFVLVQGDKPKNSALTRDDDAAYPNAVVTFRQGKTQHPGLISGTVDYEPGDYCPASAAMTHADLNKDKSTLAGREQQYEAAKALATAQTRHEWRRLNMLLHRIHSMRAVGARQLQLIPSCSLARRAPSETQAAKRAVPASPHA